jgi:hypothetical protein
MRISGCGVLIKRCEKNAAGNKSISYIWSLGARRSYTSTASIQCSANGIARTSGMLLVVRDFVRRNPDKGACASCVL